MKDARIMNLAVAVLFVVSALSPIAGIASAANPTLTISATAYYRNDIAVITVTGATGSPSVYDTVNVAVESNVTGSIEITVGCSETGLNTNTYTGTFKFNASNAFNGDDAKDILKVSPNCKINVSYAGQLKTALYKSVNSVTYLDPYTQSGKVYNVTEYFGYSKVQIYVTDRDANNDSSVKDRIAVNVAAYDDPTDSADGPITVVLEETAVDSSIFGGNFTFGAASDDANNVLKADDERNVFVNYSDLASNGQTILRSKTALWNKTYTATAVFSDNDLGYGTTEIAKIYINDKDINLNTQAIDALNVEISNDRTGGKITIRCNETGFNTSIFEGIFNVADSRLAVIAGDIIRGKYADVHNVSGALELIVDTANIKFTDASQQGYVRIYNDESHTGSIDDPSDTEYYQNDLVYVFVMDQNVPGASPTAYDTVNVVVGSDASSAGTITVGCVETDVGSNVYVGSFGMGAATSQSSFVIKAVANSRLSVKYTDVDYGEASKEITHYAYFRADNATISLDKDEYWGKATATVAVDDGDANKNAGAKDTVQVTLTGGRRITLTEDAVNSGVFTGTFKFGTDVSPSDGAEISATYSDYDELGGTASRADTATWHASYTAEVYFSQAGYNDTYEGLDVYFYIEEPELNKNQYASEIIIAKSYSFDGTVKKENITCTETGVNTGIFRGTYEMPADIAVDKICEVSYVDPHNETGNEETINAAAKIIGNVDDVEFGIGTYYGKTKAYLYVNDSYCAKQDITKRDLISVKVSCGALSRIVTLRETGENSGHFEGNLTLASDIALTESYDNRTLALTYYDHLDGVQATGTAKWRYTELGTVYFGASSYTSGVNASVYVDDFDANANSSVREWINGSVLIYSDRSEGKITINLQETGVNTHVFKGVFNTSDETLNLGPGYKVYANYTDDQNATNETQTRTSVAMTIASESGQGIINLDKSVYYQNDILTVAVMDSNVPGASSELYGTITISLVSDADGATPVTITCYETASNSNTYVGTKRINELTSLKLVHGTEISASYEDAKYGTGSETRTVVALAAFKTASGTLYVDNTAYWGKATSTVMVNDIDGNVNSGANDTVEITVESSIGSITLDLTETGRNTGVFSGAFKFGTDISAADEDTIYINYTDASNATGVEKGIPKTAVWRDAETGAIEMDSETGFYSLGAIAKINVTDSDRNLDPNYKEAFTIYVYKSGGTKIAITCAETDKDNGIFHAEISTSDSRIGLQSGDWMYVEYGDLHNANGVAQMIGITQYDTPQERKPYVKIATPATISIGSTECWGLTSTSVVVIDPDANRYSWVQESITIEANTTSDTQTITLTEYETNSSMFIGTLYFNALDKDDGELVTVTYEDYPDNAERVATVLWHDSELGQIAMYNTTGKYTSTTTEYTFGEPVYMQVTDKDANYNSNSAETIFVSIYNFRTGGRLTVSCAESGANTGAFRGSFSTSDSALGFIPGDTIQASYADIHNIYGWPQTVIDKSTAIHREPTQGYVYLNDYEINGGYYYKLNDEAVVTVKDSNAASDPYGQTYNTVTVVVTSSAPGAGSIVVGCTETTKTSGIYEGRFYLSYSQTDSSTYTLKAVAGSKINVTYLDSTYGSSGQKTVNMVSEYHTENAALKLSSNTGVAIGSCWGAYDAWINVSDWDMNSRDDVADTIDAKVVCGTSAISVDLIESGANTGVFLGNFTFSEAINDDARDILKVSNGAAFTVNYTDFPSATGATRYVIKTGRWYKAQTAEVSFAKKYYVLYQDGLSEEAYKIVIQVEDQDRNLNPLAFDEFDVAIYDTTKTIALAGQRCRETGVNTGIFQAILYTWDETNENETWAAQNLEVGEDIYVQYVDPHNATGTSKTIWASARIVEDESAPAVRSLLINYAERGWTESGSGWAWDYGTGKKQAEVKSNEWVNITAEVADDKGVQSVKLYGYNNITEESTGSVFMARAGSSNVWYYNFTSGLGLPEGYYTLMVEATDIAERVTDTADNAKYGTVWNISIEDSTAPQIKNAKVNKATAQPGEAITVSAQITEFSLAEAKVQIYSGATLQGEYEMAYDGATGLYVNTMFAPLNEGVYELRIFANDSNGNSNTASIALLVMENKADLYVSDITVSKAVLGGQADITATIENTGDEDANSFLCVIKVDNKEVRRQTMSIAAKESATMTVQWTVDESGEHTVKATADAGYSIVEYGEANNVKTEQFNAYYAEMGTVGSLTYLNDTNGDGTPDLYWNPATGTSSDVSEATVGGATVYVFDTDGDGTDDKAYNPETGALSDYAEPSEAKKFIPGFEILPLLAGVALALLVRRKLR